MNEISGYNSFQLNEVLVNCYTLLTLTILFNQIMTVVSFSGKHLFANEQLN